jgi:hypothetical protein
MQALINETDMALNLPPFSGGKKEQRKIDPIFPLLSIVTLSL